MRIVTAAKRIRVTRARQAKLHFFPLQRTKEKVREKKIENCGKEIRSTQVINSFTDKEFIFLVRVSKSPFSYISFDRLNYVTRWTHIPGGCLGTGGEK